MPTGCGKHEIADYLTGACLFLSFPDSETLGQELFSTPFTTRARISPGLNFPSISTAAVLPGATFTAKETSLAVLLLLFLFSDDTDGQTAVFQRRLYLFLPETGQPHIHSSWACFSSRTSVFIRFFPRWLFRRPRRCKKALKREKGNTWSKRRSPKTEGNMMQRLPCFRP